MSVSLVFEREKCDAALLKLCKVLRKGGHIIESEWLESQTSKFNQRDFKIKESKIQLAREKERPTKKSKELESKKRKKTLKKSSDFEESSGRITKKQNDKSNISQHKQSENKDLMRRMVRDTMVTMGEISEDSVTEDEDEDSDGNSIDREFIVSDNEIYGSDDDDSQGTVSDAD